MDAIATFPVTSRLARIPVVVSHSAAIVSSISETMPEGTAGKLIANGIAPLCEIDEALAAADAAARIGQSWRLPFPPPLLAAEPAQGTPVTLF